MSSPALYSTDVSRPARRWTERSDDPNSTAAHEHRAGSLRAARRPPVADRVAYLQCLARGRKVLDVGVVGHFAGSAGPPSWLHRQIAEVAAYCLGVDVLVEAIAALQTSGYNVRQCDVTCDRLDETFDVIICGEVVEHLGNPGSLFDFAARTLAPRGRLVLTTPNPYYLFRVLTFWRGRGNESVYHVASLLPSGIAEMSERAGVALDCFRGELFRPNS